MKMTADKRAIDKIYKRRDRYDIPEWQRGEVWNDERKQNLIDTILRGWKLPKFYFVKLNDNDYYVVDGQQRLNAIFEFFTNELKLSDDSVKLFGGPFYNDLKPKFSDAFDDFEIEYDEIENASEEDQKLFFQRLQQGLPLTSSEKLNSIHSKLRDFCRKLTKHKFFNTSVVLPDTRYSHFDIASKVSAIEIEGLNTGLRYDDLSAIFSAQSNFSATSAVAKRIEASLDFLLKAFPSRSHCFRNRSVIQSLITFAIRLVSTGKYNGLDKILASFVNHFITELGHQVELGQAATDYDFIRFQKSISANVKEGCRIRHEILLRKAFIFNTNLAAAFDPSVLVESGINGRIKELSEQIVARIGQLNSSYSSTHGEDLFKPTNRTTQAMLNISKPATDINTYKNIIDELYFLFWESVGQRLAANMPKSFTDVNALRTDMQHDVDHGSKGKIKAKRTKIGLTFKQYSGATSPYLLDPMRFTLVQANLLSALELDLNNLPTN